MKLIEKNPALAAALLKVTLKNDLIPPLVNELNLLYLHNYHIKNGTSTLELIDDLPEISTLTDNLKLQLKWHNELIIKRCVDVENYENAIFHRDIIKELNIDNKK